jgi:hypothetical protein
MGGAWCPLLQGRQPARYEVRKYADGHRDQDAFRIEVPFAPILPIEASARKRCVRQPGDRDVVENVVACKAFGFSGKDP